MKNYFKKWAYVITCEKLLKWTEYVSFVRSMLYNLIEK